MAGDQTPIADCIVYGAIVNGAVHVAVRVSTTCPLSKLATSAGLVFDFLGAFLIAVGLLWQYMASMRWAREQLQTPEAAPPGLAARIANQVAFVIGSKDVRTTNSSLVGNYTELFWGLFLLMLGFACQLAGNWLPAN